jgi:HK97 family phage prohead protease
MMKQAEVRSPAAYNWPVELRVKDEGDGPKISGYAVLYNQRSVDLGGFVEEIAPGAFGGSLGGDVRALWQHDTAAVLGRTTAGTLRIWDDERGVAFELDPPDTQIGRDAVTSDGDKRGDAWSDLDDGTYLRRVVRAELLEVSPVTWAAYPQTAVGVRSDEIYGVLPEIPAELRAQDAGDNAGDGADDRARARAESRRRRLQLATID